MYNLIEDKESEKGVMPLKRQRGWEEGAQLNNSSGSWVCDYCSMFFGSYVEACDHENQCGSRTRSGDAASQALGLAVAAAVAASSENFTKYLADPNDRNMMSELDFLLCRNVETFSANEDDVRDSAYSQSCGSATVVGQMGLRCLHCNKSPLATARFASLFPGSIGSIGKSLRMMGEYHFSRCGMCPSDVKDAIQRAWIERLESDEATLEDFCLNVFAHRMGIVNMIPSKTGVIFSSLNTAAGARRDFNQASRQDSATNNNGRVYRQSTSPTFELNPQAPQMSRISTSITPITHNQYNSSTSIVPTRGPTHPTPASSSATKTYYGGSCRSVTQPSPGHSQLSFTSQQHLYMPRSSPQQPSYSQLTNENSRYISHVFIRDSMGWSCRHCNSLPYHYRAPGSVVPTREYPSLQFIEQHLSVCQGMTFYSPQQHQHMAHYSNSLQSPEAALKYLADNAPPHSPSCLVLKEDKSLLTDYFYYLIQQLKLCRFSESDRKTRGGKRENVKLGFGGLECRHCAISNPGSSRKFFWSNVDRLANSFAEIPSHVLKCRNCDQAVKTALLVLKSKHPEQMAKLPRGSQKVFFRRMWRRVHMDVEDPKTAVPLLSDKESEDSDKNSESADKKKTPLLLAISIDKDWLSDTDCFVRRNIEVFCATEEDLISAQSDRKYPIVLNQVGIRCLHCAQSTDDVRGNAVSFPYSIDGLYESVRELQKMHLESCPNFPPNITTELSELKTSTSLSSVLRRYYVLAAKTLGMTDTADGIRLGGEAIALGVANSLNTSGLLGSPAELIKKGEEQGTPSGKRKSSEHSAGSSETKKKKVVSEDVEK